jgi:methionyl-tRNA formyltransferase
MRVGIISDSDSLIPLVYTLAAQKLQVYLFYSSSPDQYINQKVSGFVKQFHIPLTEEKNYREDLYQWLIAGNYDACFVIGYKHLIHLKQLNGCSTPLFNIHFGPLPSFKGPVPIFWQLKQGVEKLGLVIHRLSQKFDEGPVVWKKETDNLPHYNFQLVKQLFSQLCVEGVFYILQVLMNKIPLPVIDNTTQIAAYQKRPELKDVLINWQLMEAKEIHNLIRAGNPWNKGAASFFKGQELKLMDAVIIDAEKTMDYRGGSIVNDENCLHIICCDGKIINVNMVFYNDCFIPGYLCKQWGLVKGQKLG